MVFGELLFALYIFPNSYKFIFSNKNKINV
jgi:hypothetical protein